MLVLFFGATACDSGSSSEDNDSKTGTTFRVTERTLTPLTVDNLAGTWAYPEEPSSLYDYPGSEDIDTINTRVNKLHFFADSTYVKETIYIFTNKDDPDEKYYYYDYDKGTFTIGENILHYNETHYIYFNNTHYTDFDSAPWNDLPYVFQSIEPVFIYNDGFYTNVFTRITDGTGLYGTWESIQEYPDSTYFLYFLTQVSFDENGVYKYRYVANNTGAFEDFNIESDSTFTFVSDNIFTYKDTKNKWEGTHEVFLSGDLLALRGEYPEYCYIKETP